MTARRKAIMNAAEFSLIKRVSTKMHMSFVVMVYTNNALLISFFCRYL